MLRTDTHGSPHDMRMWPHQERGRVFKRRAITMKGWGLIPARLYVDLKPKERRNSNHPSTLDWAWVQIHPRKPKDLYLKELKQGKKGPSPN